MATFITYHKAYICFLLTRLLLSHQMEGYLCLHVALSSSLCLTHMHFPRSKGDLLEEDLNANQHFALSRRTCWGSPIYFQLKFDFVAFTRPGASFWYATRLFPGKISIIISSICDINAYNMNLDATEKYRDGVWHSLDNRGIISDVFTNFQLYTILLQSSNLLRYF